MANPSIAFITTNRLGDALSHTPCIRFLKTHLKGTSISIITHSAAAYAVFKGNPHVEAVHDASRGIPEDLKGLKFDLIISAARRKSSIPICQAIYGDQLFLGGLTKTKIAGEIKQQSSALSGAEAGHTCTLTIEALRKALRITETCDDYSYELPFTEDDQGQVGLKLHTLGIATQPLISLHLGCRAIRKRFSFGKKELDHEKAWRLENATRFCRLLAEHHPDVRCLATGTQAEGSYTRELAKRCPNVIDAVDMFSIKEAAALMHHLKACIAPDTGMLHIAASTSVPIVGLYAVMNPKWTGPYPGRTTHTTIIEDSMDAITGEMVYEAINTILQNEQRPIEQSPTSQEYSKGYARAL